MKKLLISFLLSLSYFFSVGQVDSFPIVQGLGSGKTLINSPGAIRSHFIDFIFTDTSQVNTLSYLKWYNGARVMTTTGGLKTWGRYNGAWVLQSGGGSGSSGWDLFGNTLTNPLAFLGTVNNLDLNFGTTNLKRFSLDKNGIKAYNSNVMPWGIDTTDGKLAYSVSPTSYFINPASGDTLFTNPSTDHFLIKSHVLGLYMLSANVTDTTFGEKVDTASMFPAIRATISVGNQTPWLQNINANNFGVDSISHSLFGAYTGTPATNTYATWNPSDKYSTVNLTNGNLTATTNGNDGSVRSTVGVFSGKWYWEYKLTAFDNVNTSMGIATSAMDLSSFVGRLDAFGKGIWGSGLDKVTNNTFTSFGSGNIALNDVLGMALDMDAGTLKVYKNGVLIGTAFTGLSGTYFAAVGNFSNVDGITANFGATAFAYSVPVGYNSGLYTSSGSGVVYNEVFKTDSMFAYLPSLTVGAGVYALRVGSDGKIYKADTTATRFGVSGEDDVATQDRVFDGGTHVLQMNWRSPYDATQTLNFFPYYHVDGAHNIAEIRVQANQSGPSGSGNYLSVGVDNSSGVVLNAGDNTGEHKAVIVRTDSILFITNNGATINTAFAVSGVGAGLPAVSFPSIQKATSLGTNRVALIDTASKQISYINYDSLRTAIAVPLSGITAATRTNSIANGANTQTWNWDGALGSGPFGGLALISNTTTASASSDVLYVSASGANGSSGIETYAAQFVNTHTGTSSTNTAAKFTATGGTNNIAIRVPASGGSVVIGSNVAPKSTFDLSGSFGLNYVAKAAGYTLTATDYLVDVTANSNNYTLPTAVGCAGRIYTIKNSGSGAPVVNTTSSETIDAATTYTLATQYKYCSIMSNGTNWIVIANN